MRLGEVVVALALCALVVGGARGAEKRQERACTSREYDGEFALGTELREKNVIVPADVRSYGGFYANNYEGYPTCFLHEANGFDCFGAVTPCGCDFTVSNDRSCTLDDPTALYHFRSVDKRAASSKLKGTCESGLCVQAPPP
eukprot:CAMPEP_0119130750 /NCGR_PEP_ID=MMETSP1310-20130426/8637_1 /TAXON_ID=464262 /ORGANISM="Genus nov. species nov., Strain RCC2339" /LENGTH=141 /DNA_ID=CAMNT_0007121279 /DNA_START=54 /DNA_END=475 /DNA_ORIENTATION=+